MEKMANRKNTLILKRCREMGFLYNVGVYVI